MAAKTDPLVHMGTISGGEARQIFKGNDADVKYGRFSHQRMITRRGFDFVIEIRGHQNRHFFALAAKVIGQIIRRMHGFHQAAAVLAVIGVERGPQGLARNKAQPVFKAHDQINLILACKAVDFPTDDLAMDGFMRARLQGSQPGEFFKPPA